MDYHPATLGGVQTAVASLSRGLERAGHRVTLFVAPGESSIAPSGVELPNVVELNSVTGLVVNGFSVVAPNKRNAVLIDDVFAARGPVDLVHTHTTYGAAIAGLKAARRHRIPLVHTAQSRDDAFIEHTSPAPYPTALAMRVLHGRFVPHRRGAPRGGQSRAAYHAWHTIVAQAQAADRVVAPTRHFAELMREHGLTRPMAVVSNGVDDGLVENLTAAATSSERATPQDAPLRLIWCGRLSAEKRLLESIEAVASVCGCTLDIYGAGGLGSGVAETIVRRGLADRVQLHGQVSQAECLRAMAGADALLFPSYGYDTQGMVVLEAIAAGLPVIYCDPALDESLPTGGGVRTTDPSPQAMASTIRSLVENHDTLTGMRAVQCRHSGTVLQSHHIDAMLEVYQQALDEEAGTPEPAMPQSLSEVPTAPGGLPVIGHSLRALRSAPEFVTSLSGLGPIVRVYFGRQTGYLLTTPDLVREVGLGEAQLNREDLREAIADIAGGSVNVLRGAEHKLRRRMIAPALRQRRLGEYAETAADIAETWSHGLPVGREVNLMDEAHGLVLDTVSSTLFTASFSDDARREIRDNVPWLLSQVILRTALPPQIRRLRVVANRRWRAKARHLRAAIGAVVSEYRRRGEDFNDVVSALIQHTDEETGAQLDDDAIIDEAILMLAGGVGSMASLATWLWYEVMRRPEVAERLHRELDTVVGAGPVRPAHLDELTYLRQIVAETLRFWGPWISAGTADGDIEVGGITVPDGSAIMFSPYMVQHDKRYFANPESFDPSRWSPERAGEIDKKANLSFGVGRRRCMGDHFAMLEITLASAALFARWHPCLKPDYVVRASNRDFVLSPSALPVTLTPRRVPAR